MNGRKIFLKNDQSFKLVCRTVCALSLTKYCIYFKVKLVIPPIKIFGGGSRLFTKIQKSFLFINFSELKCYFH